MFLCIFVGCRSMAFLKTADQRAVSSVHFKRHFSKLVANKSAKVLLPLAENSLLLKRLTTVSATAVKDVVDAKVPPRRDPLDLTFANPEAAFKSKTTWEVLRALIVYQLCSSSYLVDNNMKVNCIIVYSDCLFYIIWPWRVFRYLWLWKAGLVSCVEVESGSTY